MADISTEVLIGKIIVLLSLSIILIYFGLRLKMPAIVGFLATGILVGPSGLGLIRDSSQVEALSELGVVLLLFTIGLEFSIQSLIKIKKTVLVGGSLQMLFCLILTFPLSMLIGYSWNTSILFGLLFSLSSTAIVLKLFQERGEMDSAHGRGAFAVLIFQDLAVVPLVLILPLLAGNPSGDPIYIVLLKVAVILILLVLMANWIVPWLMKKVAATRSNELFMFTVALVCLGTAFLTAEAGLSLALGAFMAGLVIAGSPYAYQAISSVMPMRDIFTSLFFVSIGMRMDVNYLLIHPVLTIGLALAVMLINLLTTTVAMRVLGLSSRVAVMIGFSLCQVGEFAFVLATSAGELLTPDDMAMFLNMAVLTMAMTPLSLALGRVISLKLTGLESAKLPPVSTELNGHSIVVGFGVAGQAVARASRIMGRPYVIIDMNPGSVTVHKAEGEPIIYGDAVNETILEHVGVTRAKMLVISIPDPMATRRIIAQARSLNPKLYILARTRFLLTKTVLTNLGANEVLAEEFETALAVFNSVLTYFNYPADRIKHQLSQARNSGPIQFSTPEEELIDIEENDHIMLK